MLGTGMLFSIAQESTISAAAVGLLSMAMFAIVRNWQSPNIANASPSHGGEHHESGEHSHDEPPVTGNPMEDD